MFHRRVTKPPHSKNVLNFDSEFRGWDQEPIWVRSTFDEELRDIVQEIRKEAAERAEKCAPFQKGEKSKSSYYTEIYREKVGKCSGARRLEIERILDAVRKEAAQARSLIAKSVKQNVLNEAKEIYKNNPPERRIQRREIAEKKSQKIGFIEISRIKKTYERFVEAINREIKVFNERLNRKKAPPELPQLPVVKLPKMPTRNLESSPQKKLIYNDLQNGYIGVKKQIEALNKPTFYTKSKLKYPVAHIVIGLPKDIKSSDEQAIWMCKRHMTRMGIDLKEHTYFIYKHSNTEHEHYHVVYNRVRLDGGVHHLPGANQVCHLESSLQDLEFGIDPQIKPLTARDRLSRMVSARLAKGEHYAEIRYFKKPMQLVSVTGEEAQGRIEELGECKIKSCGGGFVKHQLFHSAKWLVHHVLK